MDRECDRYGLKRDRVAASMRGDDPLAAEKRARGWWEVLVVAAAVAIFAWLAFNAQRQPIAVNVGWMVVLLAATLAFLIVGAAVLWKRTRFS